MRLCKLSAQPKQINMDIVYTLAQNYTGEELKYSLRSLENIPHERVFFVGGCPKWAKDIIHIPTNQTGTKYKNTTYNLKTVCQDERISDDFIFMNDDFFILENTTLEDLNAYDGTVQSNIDRLNKKGGSAYCSGAEDTQKLIKSLGINTPLSYELHIPFIFNKHKFLEMLDIKGALDIPCLHKRTLYGNLYLKGGKDMRDVKIFPYSGFCGKTGQFLSCSNDGFPCVAEFLKKKFPTKSIYEI